MSTLLYIQASPRGERSYSVRVAEAFLESYRQARPDDEIQTLDLFTADLPAFDGDAVRARYTVARGAEHTDAERRAWQAVEGVIHQFLAADKYLFAVPMWNFGIPHRLKQYIDILVQPGHTFSFDPAKGYQGLVTGKRALVCYARGGSYPAGTEAAEMDFQTRYLNTVFGFIGLSDVESVVVEPTLGGGPEVAEAKLSEAVEKVRALAADF